MVPYGTLWYHMSLSGTTGLEIITKTIDFEGLLRGWKKSFWRTFKQHVGNKLGFIWPPCLRIWHFSMFLNNVTSPSSYPVASQPIRPQPAIQLASLFYPVTNVADCQSSQPAASQPAKPKPSITSSQAQTSQAGSQSDSLPASQNATRNTAQKCTTNDAQNYVIFCGMYCAVC